MADLNEIADRYAEWEITGPPEARTPVAGSFSPHRAPLLRAQPIHDDAHKVSPHLELSPAIDSVECFLARTFLRRYVTYCARRRRYSQLNGAAMLYAEITAVEIALHNK